MDVQALTTPNRIELTAPPPPIRHRFQMPKEPLVFAIVMVALTLGLARALPQADASAETRTTPHALVAANGGR